MHSPPHWFIIAVSSFLVKWGILQAILICFYFIVIIGKIFEYSLCLHLVIKDTLSRMRTGNFFHICCYCRQDRCERQLMNVFDFWIKYAFSSPLIYYSSFIIFSKMGYLASNIYCIFWISGSRILFLFYCYYWQNIWIFFMFTLSNKRHA
jgi:hypothetical protein